MTRWSGMASSETAFGLMLEAKVGVNHLSSQEKNAAERENSPCGGPEEGEIAAILEGLCRAQQAMVNLCFF